MLKENRQRTDGVLFRRCNSGVEESSKGSDGVRMGSKGEAVVTSNEGGSVQGPHKYSRTFRKREMSRVVEVVCQIMMSPPRGG